MISGLKKELSRIKTENFLTEAAVDAAIGTDDDIRDAILDDPETVLAGAEDDPEIEKLVEKIPEYDEEVTDKDLEKLEESYIPESIIK